MLYEGSTYTVLPLIQRRSSLGNIQRISSFVISRIYTQIQLFSTTLPPGCLPCVICVIRSGLDSLGLVSLTSEALLSAMTWLAVHKMRSQVI